MASAALSVCGRRRPPITRAEVAERAGAPAAGYGREGPSARLPVRQARGNDDCVGRLQCDGADGCGGQTDPWQPGALELSEVAG